MEAILPQFVSLPTILKPGVAHIHDAIVQHCCGEAFQIIIEVVTFTGDDDRPLQVHNLSCRLKDVPLDLGKAAHMV